MNEQNEIEVNLASANGPRVIAAKGVDAAEIEAALPEGWTVGDNWHLQIDLGNGRYSYPIVQIVQIEMTVGEIIQALKIQQRNGQLLAALDARPKISYDEAELISDLMQGHLRTLGYTLRDSEDGSCYQIWPRGE